MAVIAAGSLAAVIEALARALVLVPKTCRARRRFHRQRSRTYPLVSGGRARTVWIQAKDAKTLLSVAWLFMWPGTGSRRPCSLLALSFSTGDASQLGMWTYPERYRCDYDDRQADHDAGSHQPRQSHVWAVYSSARCDYQDCRQQYGPGASTYGTACRWKHVNTLTAIAAAISVGR